MLLTVGCQMSKYYTDCGANKQRQTKRRRPRTRRRTQRLPSDAVPSTYCNSGARSGCTARRTCKTPSPFPFHSRTPQLHSNAAKDCRALQKRRSLPQSCLLHSTLQQSGVHCVVSTTELSIICKRWCLKQITTVNCTACNFLVQRVHVCSRTRLDLVWHLATDA